MEVEQSVVAPIIASLRPRRALDIGTGSGRYLPFLAATGARLVVGVDRSGEMLQSREDGLPRVRGDACRLPFGDGCFDLLSASLMVGDVERLDCLMTEVSRVLAPGGHLVYSDFHPLWANRKWRRTFRAADGCLYQLPYFPHAIGEHLALLDQHSLTVRVIREPRIVPPRARYSLVGHRDVPAVVVFHAIKRNGSAVVQHLRTSALPHIRISAPTEWG
jgi:malonyl-CoA O-methyltransferase